MFFALALLASVTYALQGALMAKWYRRLNGLSSATFRGLSLGLTMSPCLLFVPREDWNQFPAQILLVIPACLSGFASNFFAAASYRYLSVGMSAAFCLSLSALFSIGIGYLLLTEMPSPMQLVFSFLIIFSVFGLGFSLRKFEKKQVREGAGDLWRGLRHCAFYAFFSALAYVFVAKVSRAGNPILAGFLWEFGIGLVGVPVVFYFRKGFTADFFSFRWRQFVDLAFCASPTIVGTMACLFAVTMGSVSVATAILGTMMIPGSLFGYLLYREKVHQTQFYWMIALCVAVAGLRLFG